ncbi:MAG: MBL fold metallo-hydrolase, partial [Halioglobus sp.]|nr:MBL fold metallo-hydrolase [Halioglobus sp.]
MTDLPYDTLSHGITCIDAHYIDAGMACFYLLGSDGEYAVIETGTNHSLANLQQLMSAAAIDPQQVRYVIPTHVHLDHAG